MNYSYNEMKRAFECGRNFQLTGENNFQELIEELNQTLRQPTVMPRLSIQQIESIEIMQIGEMFPKKLKHLVIKNPMTNVAGLVRINGEYYQWVSCR